MAIGWIYPETRRPYPQRHYISLIDYVGLDSQCQSENLDTIAAEPNEQYPPDTNIYKFVNQLEIVGTERRIPDGILYVNGLPVVVFEFKTAIQENTTIHNAYIQLTTRYKRDIPELFKYNAFCIISDGVNNKAGSFFAPYEFYYAWRRITGLAKDVDGIDSMFTLVQGYKTACETSFRTSSTFPMHLKKMKKSFVAIRSITLLGVCMKTSKKQKSPRETEKGEPTLEPQEAERVLLCSISPAC